MGANSFSAHRLTAVKALKNFFPEYFCKAQKSESAKESGRRHSGMSGTHLDKVRQGILDRGLARVERVVGTLVGLGEGRVAHDKVEHELRGWLELLLGVTRVVH